MPSRRRQGGVQRSSLHKLIPAAGVSPSEHPLDIRRPVPLTAPGQCQTADPEGVCDSSRGLERSENPRNRRPHFFLPPTRGGLRGFDAPPSNDPHRVVATSEHRQPTSRYRPIADGAQELCIRQAVSRTMSNPTCRRRFSAVPPSVAGIQAKRSRMVNHRSSPPFPRPHSPPLAAGGGGRVS